MHPDNYILIGNIRVDEPLGTLTDILLAVFCIVFFFWLHRSGKKDLPVVFIKYFFLLLAVAALWGGILGHAFYYALSKPWKLPAWIVSMIAIMLIERAAIEHNRIFLKESWIGVMRVINIVEFLIFLGLTLYYLEFIYVEIHAAYGLLIVLFSLELFLFIKTRNAASKFLLFGVGMAGIAFYIFHNRLSPGVYFDALTLSHIFMILAVLLFYEGARRVDMTKVEGG